MKFDVLECPKTRVHVVKSGSPDGNPLLLIHGAPGSWKDWEGLIEGPQRLESFRVWAVDRPGFGLSNRSQFEASFEHKIEDLVHVALELALSSGKPLMIAGHSYGAALAGRVACEVAAKGVELAGLVLISGVLCQWSNHPRWYHRVLLNSPLKLLSPRRYLRGAREMMGVRQGLLELESRWENFPCPLGLIHGIDDRLIAPENSEYVKDQAGSNVVFELWLDSIGHRIPQKRPSVVKQGLLEMYKAMRSHEVGGVANGAN